MMMVYYLILVGVTCSFLGYYLGRKNKKKSFKTISVEKDPKYIAALYRTRLLKQWFILGRDNISVVDALRENGWVRIAVYGYGVVGKLLISELEDNNFQVPYVIDRRKDEMTSTIPVYTLSDTLPECDVIIVTTNNLSEVKGKIEEKYPIILFEDILNLFSDIL